MNEISEKSPDVIFKALLVWHVVHQQAIHEKIFEEQERISLLLEELLDVIYETDELISASQNEVECTSPLSSVDHNTTQSEGHHQHDQEPSRL